jgi:uncharacterized damage-inducible protein DinB
MLETYLDLLELDYFELGEALEGLADENVWKRPTENSLSVGEIVGHICYAEATRLGGVRYRSEDATKDMGAFSISSPLIDRRLAYYPVTLTTPPSNEHRMMTASDLRSELARVHAESLAAFRKSNPDLDSLVEGLHHEITHKENLKYMIFHMAYHTGQIYVTRHLLGEETVDN